MAGITTAPRGGALYPLILVAPKSLFLLLDDWTHKGPSSQT